MRTRTRRRPATCLADWTGRDVEVRTNGGIYRGCFRGQVDWYLLLERHDGHEVLVDLDHVTAIIDQAAPYLPTREPEERVGDEVEA